MPPTRMDVETLGVTVHACLPGERANQNQCFLIPEMADCV